MKIVHEALALYRRYRFFAAINRDFAALHRDSAAWNDEVAERKAWDVGSADASDED